MNYKLGDYIIDKLRYTFLKVTFSKIDKSNKILDLGCGFKPYKNLYENFKESIGIDLETSVHLNSEIDFFYDGKNIPFEKDYFDCVLCTEVLEHVENPDLFLKEINRVLERDGILILTVPFLQLLHEIPYDFNRFTPFALKKILHDNGFEFEHIEGLGSPSGFVINLLIRRPLKLFNKIAKLIRFKSFYSWYNPFIFIFIFLPQYFYVGLSKNLVNEEVFGSKTCKTYAIIARKIK